jgi:hypothetical protein
MKALGKMEYEVVKEHTSIITETGMWADGWMIANKAKELYKCRLETHTPVNGKIAKNTGRECTNLVMMTTMKDNSWMVCVSVKAYINGLTVVFMMENGKQIK